MEAKHIEEYLGYLTHEKQLSKRTITEYHRDLSQFVFWCCDQGKNPLNIDHHDTREYIRILSQNGRAKTSLCRSISALRSFYRWANLDGYSEQDAAVYLTFPRLPEKKPVYLNERECKMLLESIAEGDGLNDICRRARIKILYYCGLRAKELTSMKMEQIEYDLEDDPIRLKVIGKRGKERYVAIAEPVRKDLRKWITHRQSLRDWNYARDYKVRAEYICSEYLFPSIKGEEITYTAIEKTVKQACKKAGIEKKITPHKLRHTCATNLVRRGMPLIHIAKFLGHEDIKTTQIYAHIESEDVEKALHSTHVKPEGGLN